MAPFLVLSTATLLMMPAMAADLGASPAALQLAQGLAEAGYAFGVVLATDLVRRVSGRVLYLACTLALTAGSIGCALAGDVAVLVAGRAVQGIATGIVLVVAVPPLLTGHGGAQVPFTVALLNIGLFGGSAFGTTIGGLLTGPDRWRLLFAAVAVVAVGATLLGRVTFRAVEPAAPGAGFDPAGIPLAAVATVLPFLGLSALRSGPALSATVLVPIGIGVAALLALVVAQYREQHPLMPARLIAHTLPIIGLVCAMLTGAGYTALLQLTVTHLQQAQRLTPPAVAAVTAAQVAGLAIGVWLIQRSLGTRWLPVLALGGLAAVGVAGTLLLTVLDEFPVPVAAVACVLLGFGATTGVGPGLFLGALSVTSTRLGPAFALVQLLRAEAAFLLGPVLVQTAGGDITRSATVVAVAAAVGIAVLTAVLLLGGSRPQRPDLDTWVDGQGPAFRSPPLLAVLRANKHEPSPQTGKR